MVGAPRVHPHEHFANHSPQKIEDLREAGAPKSIASGNVRREGALTRPKRASFGHFDRGSGPTTLRNTELFSERQRRPSKLSSGHREPKVLADLVTATGVRPARVPS